MSSEDESSAEAPVGELLPDATPEPGVEKSSSESSAEDPVEELLPVATPEPSVEKSSEGEDRRQNYRLNKVLGAEIDYEEMSFQARLFVIDISITGFRATNQFSLPVNCDLKVRIILQPNHPALEGGARIVWSKELPMSGLFQFGFEFRDLNDAQRQQLEGFIAHERAAAAKPAPTVDLGRPWTTIRQ